MKTHMTVFEYQKLIKPSKYRNQKTETDGIVFDSKAEANRYAELRHLEMAGEIRGFKRQPSFLFDNGVRYRPDFIVFGKEEIWVEDVKGFETEGFRLKQKMWQHEYPALELRVIKR